MQANASILDDSKKAWGKIKVAYTMDVVPKAANSVPSPTTSPLQEASKALSSRQGGMGMMSMGSPLYPPINGSNNGGGNYMLNNSGMMSTGGGGGMSVRRGMGGSGGGTGGGGGLFGNTAGSIASGGGMMMGGTGGYFPGTSPPIGVSQMYGGGGAYNLQMQQQQVQMMQAMQQNANNSYPYDMGDDSYYDELMEPDPRKHVEFPFNVHILEMSTLDLVHVHQFKRNQPYIKAFCDTFYSETKVSDAGVSFKCIVWMDYYFWRFANAGRRSYFSTTCILLLLLLYN